MRTVIIHGKKVSPLSPRAGREDCELWGVTRANARFWDSRLLDWTRWADTHPLVHTSRFAGIPERRPDGWKWMLAQDGRRPIYLMAPEEHPAGCDIEEARRRFNMVPGAVPFPIRAIQNHFPVNGQPNRWFIEQTGMLMAFAGMEGFERVILNGIGTMINRADFIVAHMTILYWIGHLRGMGVRVEVEGPSIYHMPAEIYSYEKFNYSEIDAARLEAKTGISYHEIEALDEVNRKLAARGRPPRRRIA